MRYAYVTCLNEELASLQGLDMEIGWLWVALGLAWMVNLLLFVLLLRLRMEVWANRRVIAALEAMAHNLI